MQAVARQALRAPRGMTAVTAGTLGTQATAEDGLKCGSGRESSQRLGSSSQEGDVRRVVRVQTRGSERHSRMKPQVWASWP